MQVRLDLVLPLCISAPQDAVTEGGIDQRVRLLGRPEAAADQASIGVVNHHALTVRIRQRLQDPDRLPQFRKVPQNVQIFEVLAVDAGYETGRVGGAFCDHRGPRNAVDVLPGIGHALGEHAVGHQRLAREL